MSPVDRRHASVVLNNMLVCNFQELQRVPRRNTKHGHDRENFFALAPALVDSVGVDLVEDRAAGI